MLRLAVSFLYSIDIYKRKLFIFNIPCYVTATLQEIYLCCRLLKLGNFEFTKNIIYSYTITFFMPKYICCNVCMMIGNGTKFLFDQFFFTTCIKYYLNIWSKINGRLDNTLKRKITYNIYLIHIYIFKLFRCFHYLQFSFLLCFQHITMRRCHAIRYFLSIFK